MRILFPAIIALVLSGPALAQPADDPHHPQGAAASAAPPAPQGMMGMMQGMMKCPLAGHAEGTLAFLKTELKISAGQTKPWESFATAYRDIAASHTPMMGEGMMAGDRKAGGAMAKPFPERMAMHTKMMERHLAAAKKFQAAVHPFYAALDAQQKKTADELLPMIGMMAAM